MTTLILIGGHSSRMGRDKGLIVRPDGRRQIDFLVDLARHAGGEILLSMREDSPPPVDLPVIVDQHRGAGPLAALAAFHDHRREEAALVLSCDLFLLDDETVSHLLASHDASHRATCFPNRLDGLPEPLCAIYEPAALSQAKEWLEKGERGARRFLRSLEPKLLQLPHPAALENANTPHELAECFSKLSDGVIEKTVTVDFAREGIAGETIVSLANTAGGLYEELCFLRRLDSKIGEELIFRNGLSGDAGTRIGEGDHIQFRMAAL